MLNWTESHNCYTAPVGRMGTLNVFWTDRKGAGGYEVCAFGVKLKKLSPDVEDGKCRAIKLAHKLLAEAGEALPAEEGKP